MKHFHNICAGITGKCFMWFSKLANNQFHNKAQILPITYISQTSCMPQVYSHENISIFTYGQFNIYITYIDVLFTNSLLYIILWNINIGLT